MSVVEIETENRSAIRLPISLPVRARFGRTTHNLVTLNVSVDGAFVVGAEPPARGHLVHLSFLLPDHQKPTPLQGMVMRTVTGDEARDQAIPAGMGIMYYGLGSTNQRTWEEFFHLALSEYMQRGGVAHPPTPALVKSELEVGESTEPSQELAFEDGRPTSRYEDKDPFDEPTGRWQPTNRTSLSAVSPVQAPESWQQPILFRVCPPDVDGLWRFRAEALESGGVMLKGTTKHPPGNPAVVAVVHPKSKAEFHVPAETEPSQSEQPLTPARFLGVTPRTKKEFELFIESAGRPPSAAGSVHGPADQEMVLFESADEAQWDVVFDHGGAVLVEGVLPLQAALDPFGRKR